MGRLFDFLYKRREIGLFLILQTTSIWLIFGYNQRPNTNAFNTSNAIAGSISSQKAGLDQYLKLKEANEILADENGRLRSILLKSKAQTLYHPDTISQFSVIDAQVISNTYGRSENFLTLSAGESAGIQVGMGVIGANGVVGQIKSVSKNFSTVYSVLHPGVMVSSRVKRTKTQCTVQWDRSDFYTASLKYIPKHVNLYEGDTIVTSGFNSVFPPGVLVGVVESASLEDFMTFYEARVRLATDFTSLYNVYVLKDAFLVEKDSIEVQ
ncbi:MAG: rod shape-determining protein MreC [Bacteroidota bacterium]